MSDHKTKGEHSAANKPKGSGSEKQQNGEESNSRTAHKQNSGHGGHK